ncbi:hypothetical protein LAZ67_15000598, partial [Cordylochernes scorpioides]
MVETRSGKMQDTSEERLKTEESAKPQPRATIGRDASADPVVLNPNIDIPKYDGTEYPRPWIESLEEIGFLYHWAEYIISRYAAMNMIGSAKTRLDLHKISFTSWEHFKSRLIQDFASDANKEELKMRLNRMQQWNEPAIRFAEDILVLCNKVDPQMEEENKINWVIGGLKKEYSFALYLNPPKNTNELLRLWLCEALIDTGADLSVVDLRTAIFAGREINSLTKTCSGPDGKKLDMVGSIILDLKIDDTELSHEFVVMDAHLRTLILGRDFLKKMNAKIDCKRETIKYNLMSNHDVSNYDLKKIKSTTNTVIPKLSIKLIRASIEAEDGEYVIEENKRMIQTNGLRLARSLLTVTDKKTHIWITNPYPRPLKIMKDETLAYGSLPAGVNFIENKEKQNENDEIQFQINKNLSFKEQERLKQILAKYTDLFSSRLGRTNLEKKKIHTEDAKPIKHKPYRVSAKERTIIKDQIDEMLEEGIIRQSSSPWSFPVILVKKRDGKYRFCVDYRKLNEVTVKDVYQIPRIDDVMDTLQGSKYFSAIYLKSGYWQVKIVERDKEKTAFTTAHGLYEFNVMPFGLCNAPATFERNMDNVLGNLRWQICLCYLDDVIIYSSDFPSHIKRLEAVLRCFSESNLKLNAKKCRFAFEELEILGHITNQEGIKPAEYNIKAVRDFPQPKKAKEVQSFLGMCSYYRKFIKDFSLIADPLTSLIRKNVQFIWTGKQEEVFQNLKKALMNPPILGHFDPNAATCIHTDASNIGLGATLIQNIGGEEKVISYLSRTLSKPEQNYSTTEKECLAVVWSISKLRPYLYGRHFKIVTDHHALCWLVIAGLARWALKIQEYNFEIIHKSGKKHLDADGREWLLVVPKKRRKEIMSEYHNHMLNGHLGVARTTYRLKNKYYWPSMLKDVSEFVKTCHLCQSRKGSNQLPSGLLQPIAPANYPFERIGIDFVGPLPSTKRRRKWIIVLTDYYTKYAETKAVPEATVKEVSTFLIEHIFLRHGAPRFLISDRGSQFTSNLMKEVMKMCKVKHCFTTSYHPQTNGLTERLNRTLINMISMYVNTDQKNWDEILPFITHAYNTTIQETTGYSPFFLLFGREPMSLLDDENIPTDSNMDDYDEYIENYLDKIARTRQLIMCLRKILADDLKWRAVGRMEAGQSQVEVAKWLNVNKSVVSKIWKQFIETGTIKRKEGSGRKRKTATSEDRYLVVTAKRHREMTAIQLSNELSSATGTRISRQTVYRRLHEGALYARRPMVCIPLTSAHRRARLNWCLEHHAWTHDQWANVLFSDESRFSLNTDSRQVLIWREPGTRYHPSNIREIDSFRGGSLLVWAGISSSRRTPLHIFFWGHFNCPKSENIRRMDWPARSPDLNPIELVRDALGRRIGARHPSPRTLVELRTALLEEWGLLPLDLLQSLILFCANLKRKMEKLTDPEIEKFTKLLRLISQKVDELGENLDTRLSRLEHIRNVKRSATPMSCEVKFNVLPPENPDGFSKPITATNSPRIQCLRGQKTIPGDEDPDKTITTKIITSGDVVSELPESTLEDSPVIQKSEECRQQEMIQTGRVAEEGELIASDNGCGTSVLYKIKRTEGECPQGDIQSENSTPGILSEILHENSNDLGELQCDSVADFSDSVRLSGTTAAIQLDGTELDAPWKCDKARWSKHPEVGAGNPTERDRALDALWKSDDNVCDAEVARNVSAPSSAMQAEKMCQECVPFIFVPSPDKVQIKQPPPRKSSTDLETATGSDTSRRLKKFTALCVVGTKKPRFEGFGKREPLEKENVKPKEEKGGHDMDSVDRVDESTVKIGDLQPRRGRKRRKRNTNDHNPLYIVATECSQGEFKISDGSIVGSEIWPPSCGEPPPCARQRDQSMALALVESGKKARVEMWFCKQGLVLTLPLRFREADDPHVARDVREIKGPPISASGEISLFETKRIEKGAVKRCSREIEGKTRGSQERRYAGAPAGEVWIDKFQEGGGRQSEADSAKSSWRRRGEGISRAQLVPQWKEAGRPAED